MRKLLYSLFLVITTVCIFSSCTQDQQQINPNPAPTKITITADKLTVLADGNDRATITAKDQNGNDITTSTLFYVNDNNISTNKILFEATQVGTYKVFGTKFGVMSDTLTITSTAPGAAKYSAKVLAEDFTANWAGWCPRMTTKMANYLQRYNRLFTVRYHNGVNNPFTNRIADSTLRTRYNITSVPTVLLNRSKFFEENGDIFNFTDTADFVQFLKVRPVVGLAINSSIAGNTLNVTAKVGFDATISDSLRLIVMVVENGVIAPQANFYSANTSYPGNPYFNLANPIPNFVHNQVYRNSPTTVLGVGIPVSSQVKNGESSTSFGINIAGLVAANLQVVAFVTYGDGQIKNGILNTQWVNAGSNKNYD